MSDSILTTPRLRLCSILLITHIVGPFINDALAGMWKAGAGEFSQLQEYCTSQKQEVEADVVSIRYVRASPASSPFPFPSHPYLFRKFPAAT